MGLEMKYFVLKPAAKNRHDEYATASQDALLAYADAIRDTDPDLASELSNWAIRERNLQTINTPLR